MPSKSIASLRQRRTTAVLVLTGLLAGLAGAASFFALPAYRQFVLDRALDVYVANGAQNAEQVQEVLRLPDANRLARTIELLGKNEALPKPQRVEALNAAIRLAERQQAPLAMLVGAIAIRDGLVGEADGRKALAMFEDVAKIIAPMVRAGSPEALYLHAWLLAEGLGVLQNSAAARAAMARAEPVLRGDVLLRAFRQSDYATGPYSGSHDAERTIAMGKRLIREGNLQAYVITKLNCGASDAGTTDNQAMAAYLKQRDCEASLARIADHARMYIGYLDHGIAQLELHADIATAAERFKRFNFNLAVEQGLVIGLVNAILAQDTNAFVAAIQGLKVNLDTAEHAKPQRNAKVQMLRIVQTLNKWVATDPPASERKRLEVAFALVGKINPAYRFQTEYLFYPENWLTIFEQIREAEGREAVAVILAQIQSPVSAGEPGQETAGASSKLPTQQLAGEAGVGYMGMETAGEEGLSTFHVDNTSGGGDAIVRLYKVGSAKMVRSFAVRHGEQFTVGGLAPGDYKMRYRYNGSSAVYEALNTFALREERTEQGRRLSKISVTLYRVANGNMETVEVAPDVF